MIIERAKKLFEKQNKSDKTSFDDVWVFHMNEILLLF